MLQRIHEARQVKSARSVGFQGTNELLRNKAARILLRSFEVERRFVAAGWGDPIGLHDAAFRVELCGDRFSDRLLGFLYGYLAFCGDAGREPVVGECLALAEWFGDVPLLRCDEDWVLDLILDGDVDPARIDDYAAAVARLASIRDTHMRRHMRAICDLLRDADGVYDRAVGPRLRPTAATHIPQRLLRGGRRRAS